MSAFRTLPLVALLLAGAALAGEPPATRSFGSLAFTPCTLKAPGRSLAVEAQCASLEVAENRERPEGRRIRLHVAWIPVDGQAAPDPVFMLAGGPGQAASESYPLVHAAFADVRRSRHVILVDARGTGGSRPLLCRDAQGRPAFTEPDREDLDTARDFARRCAEALAAEADLTQYGTLQHVEDLEDVRRALGVPKINLVGISYGTRVAQQFAKRHPESTRAVVLDSVVPNTLVLGNEHAANLEAALDAHFERCRKDPGCGQQLGDPRAQLDAVAATLRAGTAPPVRFRAARSGEWKEERPAFGHLAMLLRLYAYTPQTASLLPFLLHEAAQGRFEAMLAQAELLATGLSEQIYHGMQLSVTCTEDADELRPDPGQTDSVLGNVLIEFTRAQCAVWPRGRRPADFREPLRGEMPVLLLSGELDPVTPPRYGEEVAAALPNARHLVLPGQGHNVIGLGCMPKLLARFLEKPEFSALDVACLDRLAALPPFAGPYGWEP